MPVDLLKMHGLFHKEKIVIKVKMLETLQKKHLGLQMVVQ